jgi:hypothetical protein
MHLTLAPSILSLSLALFALFTSAAFDYQNDKRLAGVIIACTALYVMNFAYSVRQSVLSFSFLASIWSVLQDPSSDPHPKAPLLHCLRFLRPSLRSISAFSTSPYFTFF